MEIIKGISILSHAVEEPCIHSSCNTLTSPQICGCDYYDSGICGITHINLNICTCRNKH